MVQYWYNTVVMRIIGRVDVIIMVVIRLEIAGSVMDLDVNLVVHDRIQVKKYMVLHLANV